MPNILALETATESCSVAIRRSDGDIVEITEVKPMIHAQKMFAFVEQCLAKASLSFKDLDAVAVSAGPGSYTGLRIGVSAAKGYCFGLSIPLIAVNSLKALALQMTEHIPAEERAILVPMIDAKRMEVYEAKYDAKLNEVEPTNATIFSESTFKAYVDTKIYIAGNGAVKAKEFFTAENHIILLPNLHCNATYVAALALEKFNLQQFEQTDLFEPFYLKDFIAGPPKKLI